MANPPKPKRIHRQVAEAIFNMPRQDSGWLDSIACVDQEYGEGTDGIDSVLRREIDQNFIGKVCSTCTVQRECFIDGVQQGEKGAVRGGQPTLEMARYVVAYGELANAAAQETARAT